MAILTKAKYYLGAENDRNTHHADVFNDLIKRAFGVDEVIMDGHHFLFEPKASMDAHDLSKINEMPSADTMLFDHDIMTAVFGDDALMVMAHLSQLPVTGGARDKQLGVYLRGPENRTLPDYSISKEVDAHDFI